MASQDASNASADLHAEPLDEAVGGDAAPSVALVEIQNGLAVLFGDRVPEGTDLVAFSFVDASTRASISTAIAESAGFGNVVAQGVNGVMQAQGLVRLAPQTLEQLKTAAPLVKDGWNLGTLASEGKFVAQVRWLPAGTATAASVAASMGPALTMMAMQWQLGQIADLAEHNIELTSKVLQVLRQEQWSEITGYHNTLLRELGHAREVGVVTDAIYEEVRGYQGALSKQWDLAEKAVGSHARELRAKKGHRERQEYLTDNGEALIADVQALLLAQTSWFIYQSLRAGHLLNTAASASADEALLKKIVTDAQALHQKTLDETDWLLDQLGRELTIIGELPGKRTLKVGASARAAKDAARMVRQMQDALATLRDRPSRYAPEQLDRPLIQIFEDDVPRELERVLPLRLELGERVLALADASCDRWDLHLRDAGWVAVTDRRVLVAKQDSFRRQGAIDIELDLDDVRYVRRTNRGNKAPVIDITTKDQDLTLKFPSWAKGGEQRAEANRLGELLASFMRLPESEVPTVPIPELGAVGDQEPRSIEA